MNTWCLCISRLFVCVYLLCSVISNEVIAMFCLCCPLLCSPFTFSEPIKFCFYISIVMFIIFYFPHRRFSKRWVFLECLVHSKCFFTVRSKYGIISWCAIFDLSLQFFALLMFLWDGNSYYVTTNCQKSHWNSPHLGFLHI